MEKSGATIKKSNEKKLSPAKAQKERENKLNLDISNFLEPNKVDQDYQAPVMSEDEFKKLCNHKKPDSTPTNTINLDTKLVKTFLTQNQFAILLKLTEKYNLNKDKTQLIDCGDYLTLIFEILANSDMIGGESSENKLITQLKSIM